MILKYQEHSSLHGREVDQWQRNLAFVDPTAHLIIDEADFGPLTDQATRRFQEAHGLDVTGEVDGPTRDLVHGIVRDWQRNLNAVLDHHQELAVDGIAGSLTQGATREFILRHNVQPGAVPLDPDLITLTDVLKQTMHTVLSGGGHHGTSDVETPQTDDQAVPVDHHSPSNAEAVAEPSAVMHLEPSAIEVVNEDRTYTLWWDGVHPGQGPLYAAICGFGETSVTLWANLVPTDGGSGTFALAGIRNVWPRDRQSVDIYVTAGPTIPPGQRPLTRMTLQTMITDVTVEGADLHLHGYALHGIEAIEAGGERYAVSQVVAHADFLQVLVITGAAALAGRPDLHLLESGTHHTIALSEISGIQTTLPIPSF